MREAWVVVSTFVVGAAVGVMLGGWGVHILRPVEPAPMPEACGGPSRMLALAVDQCTVDWMDNKRGDRWVHFQARELPRRSDREVQAGVQDGRRHPSGGR
jgi:hypothetical protein